MCFGFVEQAQGGVAVAVGAQGYEGLQPLQTQPQVSSSAGRGWGGDKEEGLVEMCTAEETQRLGNVSAPSAICNQRALVPTDQFVSCKLHCRFSFSCFWKLSREQKSGYFRLFI